MLTSIFVIVLGSKIVTTASREEAALEALTLPRCYTIATTDGAPVKFDALTAYALIDGVWEVI